MESVACWNLVRCRYVKTVYTWLSISSSAYSTGHNHSRITSCDPHAVTSGSPALLWHRTRDILSLPCDKFGFAGIFCKQLVFMRFIISRREYLSTIFFAPLRAEQIG